MASDIWLRTTQIVREETCCRHMGYSFGLTARVLLYAQSDRIAHTTAFDTPVVEHWLERDIAQWVHHMKDRSDDPSHDERTLLPRSYISLLPNLNIRVKIRVTSRGACQTVSKSCIQHTHLCFNSWINASVWSVRSSFLSLSPPGMMQM